MNRGNLQGFVRVAVPEISSTKGWQQMFLQNQLENASESVKTQMGGAGALRQEGFCQSQTHLFLSKRNQNYIKTRLRAVVHMDSRDIHNT